MARPLRKLATVRTVVRRRHRTWMLSMCCASLGWGSWWVFAALSRFAPDWAPPIVAVEWIAGLFAFFGFLVAIWTVRAKLAWILLTCVPLLANASLLAVPLVVHTLRVVRAPAMEADDARPPEGR